MPMYAFTVTVSQNALIGIQADNEEQAMRLFGKAWHDRKFRNTAVDMTDDPVSDYVEWAAEHGEYNPGDVDADLTQEAHKAIDSIKEATR
ncbi:hypothetical protein COO72_12255 [Bifidobacterium callitrichos]|nr:hypothetical protein COO72_12255 [Bifidobacterium callitrichos]